MPVEPGRVRAIFLQAAARPSPAERVAFLEKACAGDEELRRHVEILLRGHDGSCVPDLPAGEPFPDLGTLIKGDIPVYQGQAPPEALAVDREIAPVSADEVPRSLIL